jgi:hypothetical protein
MLSKYDIVAREAEQERLARQRLKTKAFLETIAIFAIIVAITLFIKFGQMDPPLSEANGGMDIVLGNDATGMNNTFEGVAAGAQQPADQKYTPLPTPVTPPPPAPAETQPQEQTPTESEDPDNVNVKKAEKEPKKITEKTPETQPTKTPPSPVHSTTTTTTKSPPAPPERKPDPNALFQKGPKGNGGTGGTGYSKGTGNTQGDQGDPNGNPNSHSWTKYGKGTEGTGPDFDLGGRGKIDIPRINQSTQVEGRIVVQIQVDKQGNVVAAHGGFRGSTITDPGLISKAEEAAKKAKFTPDPNAPDIQVGKIFYYFKLQ